MNIIPWPVIESREFYTMFPIVKRRLNKQEVTHARAGVFLQTLKTLMAKLKVSRQLWSIEFAQLSALGK
jgi:hypothetical protein